MYEISGDMPHTSDESISKWLDNVPRVQVVDI